jgi:hypothetical protein
VVMYTIVEILYIRYNYPQRDQITSPSQ